MSQGVKRKLVIMPFAQKVTTEKVAIQIYLILLLKKPELGFFNMLSRLKLRKITQVITLSFVCVGSEINTIDIVNCGTIDPLTVRTF